MPSTTSSSVSRELAVLDSNDTLMADLLHGPGEHLPDLAITVGGDRSNLSDLLVGGDLPGALANVSDNRADSDIDAALDVHRVHGGGDRLGALFDDGLRKKRRSGGAVPGKLAGL